LNASSIHFICQTCVSVISGFWNIETQDEGLVVSDD
jgi:hypothetical protein